jgi:hypothetical protein
MTMESDLTALLKTICPRVFPDFAPAGTAAPYITYQGIGGRPLRWLDGSAADKRQTLMQVNVWSTSRLDALALIRQVEAAICNLTTAPFMGQPESEPISEAEEGITPPMYGCLQDFRIISTR